MNQYKMVDNPWAEECVANCEKPAKNSCKESQRENCRAQKPDIVQLTGGRDVTVIDYKPEGIGAGKFYAPAVSCAIDVYSIKACPPTPEGACEATGTDLAVVTTKCKKKCEEGDGPCEAEDLEQCIYDVALSATTTRCSTS